MKLISKSEAETARAAQGIAADLKAGDLLYLHGDLGMGKSVFARALVRALCGDEGLDVPSPTFTLVQVYEAARCPVYHFDLYRIEDEEEIFELGWEDALSGGITIVEWPERLGVYKRQPTLDITLANRDNDPAHREIEIVNYGEDT